MGFVVPRIENRKLIACSFSHQKFLNRAPSQHVLLRAFVGFSSEERVNQEELVLSIKKELNEILTIQDEPLFTSCVFWRKAMPLYGLGHTDRINMLEKALANYHDLYLTGNAYRGVGIPDVIRQADDVAKRIGEKLRPPSQG